jgi:hypothetical protein
LAETSAVEKRSTRLADQTPNLVPVGLFVVEILLGDLTRFPPPSFHHELPHLTAGRIGAHDDVFDLG